MQIIVHDKQKQLSELGLERAESMLANTLAKFDRNIVSVELSTKRVNGPSCGLDIECRLIVRLRKMNDVVISTRGGTLSKAILNAVHRADRAVARSIKRRSLLNPDRDAKLVFSILRHGA